MKKLIISIALVLCLCFSVQAQTKHWIHTAYDGIYGGTHGKLDNIDACNVDNSGYNLQDKDANITWDQTANVFYHYIWNKNSTATADGFSVVVPTACDGAAFSNYNAGAGRWILSSPVPREFKSKAFTNGETNTEFTIADILANKYFSNLGATTETDIYLDDPSYWSSIVFVVLSAYVTEICPPSGELFDHNGDLLGANDCIDTSAVVNDKLVFTRVPVAAGGWRWSTDIVRGNHIDTGATD